MRWNRPVSGVGPGQSRLVIVTVIVVAVMIPVLLSVGAGDQKRISIYSGSANYTLNVQDRDGKEYVDLLEILQPLGATSIRSDRSSWRLRFGNAESEFIPEKARARIRGSDFDLPGKFKLENGRGLVPLASLSTLLPQFLGAPVAFRESSRRLFIGNVSVHFVAQVNRANPPSLVMNFSSPVNPMIATEPGKLRMVFTHEPLVPPGSQSLTFDSPTIPSATFQEDNGAAEIAVAGPVPLFASFSNDGRTITITPAPQAVVRPAQSPAQAPPVPSANPVLSVQPGTPPPAGAAGNSTASFSTQYFAVVDASHGGEERGAALSDQLAEKDVTLAVARSLRQELQARGFTTLLLRDGDVTLTLDQRASLANGAHPAIYICLHAGSQGSGVRLYTALLPAGGQNRGPFLDWDTAQSGFRAVSQSAESSLATEFGKRKVPVRSLAAPLRPLNNVAAAAVAIEMAPLAGNISDLNSPAYRQVVAESVVAGIEAVRDKLGAALESPSPGAIPPGAAR